MNLARFHASPKSGSFFTFLAIVASFEACDSETNGELPKPDAAISGDSGPQLDSAGIDSATEDADAIDADQGDASDAADAGPALNGLYTHLDGKLISVDPVTGATNEIGPTGQPGYVVFAWDDTAKVARVITSPAESATVTAMPKLGTINLCTGAITSGPAITLNGTQVLRAEGLAQDPGTGTFYVAFGTVAGSSNWYRSENSGTIDIATGFVTKIGSHNTTQDDADAITFVGNVLYLVDTGSIYSIAKATGVATLVSNASSSLHIAYDPTRDVTFGSIGQTDATGRGVATVNLSTGALTKLGAGIPDTTSPGKQITALVSAPKPVCP